jgi:hypothetical protein
MRAGRKDPCQQCCGSRYGSALILLSWIRILIENADPGTVTRKLTKMIKYPAFQEDFCTFVGRYRMFYDLLLTQSTGKFSFKNSAFCDG